jgi:hypothetical protein
MVIAARAGGMSYRILVNEILNLAVDRYGLVWDRGFAPSVPLRGFQERQAAR